MGIHSDKRFLATAAVTLICCFILFSKQNKERSPVTLLIDQGCDGDKLCILRSEILKARKAIDQQADKEISKIVVSSVSNSHFVHTCSLTRLRIHLGANCVHVCVQKSGKSKESLSRHLTVSEILSSSPSSTSDSHGPDDAQVSGHQNHHQKSTQVTALDRLSAMVQSESASRKVASRQHNHHTQEVAHGAPTKPAAKAAVPIWQQEMASNSMHSQKPGNVQETHPAQANMGRKERLRIQQQGGTSMEANSVPQVEQQKPSSASPVVPEAAKKLAKNQPVNNQLLTRTDLQRFVKVCMHF
jgi:hypothetical protein